MENKDYIQNAALENKMFELYGFEQNRINISGSEFLKNVTVADYGNLFNTSVAFVNLGLMFPKSLTEVFNNDKERMKDIMEKDKQENNIDYYTGSVPINSLSSFNNGVINAIAINIEKLYIDDNHIITDDGVIKLSKIMAEPSTESFFKKRFLALK